MSCNILVDASFLRDKAATLRHTIKVTLCKIR